VLHANCVFVITIFIHHVMWSRAELSCVSPQCSQFHVAASCLTGHSEALPLFAALQLNAVQLAAADETAAPPAC
jgi:hypothetical protein